MVISIRQRLVANQIIVPLTIQIEVVDPFWDLFYRTRRLALVNFWLFVIGYFGILFFTYNGPLFSLTHLIILAFFGVDIALTCQLTFRFRYNRALRTLVLWKALFLLLEILVWVKFSKNSAHLIVAQIQIGYLVCYILGSIFWYTVCVIIKEDFDEV